MNKPTDDPLKLILPKGRIQDKVLQLLSRCGLTFTVPHRSYRPVCNQPDIEAKILKPQNIPALVALGRHDCGFTGHDWVLEQNVASQVVEILDLGYDPVRIVAAMPDDLAAQPQWRSRRLVVASEYQRLAQAYIDAQQLDAVLVKTYGATEALPPEDADIIIDNTASGATLRFNRLSIVDELLRSTTRFICHPAAWEHPVKRPQLDALLTLMRSILNADQRVLLEMNVSQGDLEQLIPLLPSMRAPTVSPLYGSEGYAVKIAVARQDVPALIPRLLAAGARDILEYRLEKIVRADAP
jgi:ATP phosphoribosyltransferase